MKEVGGVRYATIAGGQTNPPRACDVPQPQPPGFGNPMAAINAAQAMMPQFSPPATARMSGQGIPWEVAVPARSTHPCASKVRTRRRA